jgi:tetratricopeptide (TPR) repeat protein
MQIAATRDLVFTKLSSLTGFAERKAGNTQCGLYQQILIELTKDRLTRETLTCLTERLISLADQAFFLRRFESLEQISKLLIQLPLPAGQSSIGRYYHGLCLKNQGKRLDAQKEFEQVVENAPRYRARALMSIGVADFELGNHDAALKLYAEAGRLAAQSGWCDPLTTIATHRNSCIIKSRIGDHAGALLELEKMTPVVSKVAGSGSYLISAHFNSLAVELTQAGRLEEALQASQLALRSPYAASYPEWRETYVDVLKLSRLSRPSRCLINVPRMRNAENVVKLPVPQQTPGARHLRLMAPKSLARVVSYFDWKSRSQLRPKQLPAETGMPLSARQMLLRIIDIASGENMTLEKLNRILKTVEAIASEAE